MPGEAKDVKARIIIKVDKADTTYPLLSVQYSIHQPTDQAGKATAPTRPDTINITKESTKDNSFAQWASSDNDLRSGTITIRDTATMSEKLREVTFVKGFISQYEEYCNAEGGSQMIESFTISAQEVNVGNEAKVTHVGMK